MENKKYFHELSQQEIDTLIADKTVGYILENYKQPDWCGYPQALSMAMGGCWSLCDLQKDGSRTKISIDFCKDCDMFYLKN